MAAEAPLQDFLEELTCSICRDYFQDPVLIPECGHNFCRDCLTRSWGALKSEASCPQCRQTYRPRSILPNRQLARVLEEARRCGDPWGEEAGSFCPKHRVPFKLFCTDHETLICVVCDRSKEHKGHWVIPAEEAFPEYQIKVEDCLKAQKEQKEKIATYKRDTEQTVQEMLDLIEKEKKNVVAEFRELQLWLEGQEKRLLTRMEETEKDIMARKEKHMEELCSLDHLIQEIEEKLQQPASKLLQDIGSILKKYRYQATKTYQNPVDLLIDSKRTVWDYSDMTVLLKRVMKKFRDTLESGLQLQEVNVIQDPHTAHPDQLDVSKDRKCVKGLKPVKRIYPDPKCERFEYTGSPYVFDRQEFSTGRYFWILSVRDAVEWGVGVAKKQLNLTDVDEETSHWQIGKWGGKYMAISLKGNEKESSELVLTEEPTRIRVSLNCEGGQVSFFDDKTAALLHTFSDSSLVGETLPTCFYVGEGTTPPSKRRHL